MSIFDVSGYSEREQRAALDRVLADIDRTPPKLCACGEELDWIPAHADESHLTGVGPWRGGWGCAGCGHMEQIAPPDEIW